MSLESTMLSTDITCKEILKILTNKDVASYEFATLPSDPVCNTCNIYVLL